MNRPLKIGPDGLVEFATEREMAHLTHCLEREATTNQRKGAKRRPSKARFVPLSQRTAQQRTMANCPLCHCQVREDRLQKHMNLKCPSRPNYSPSPCARTKSASSSRKKSTISLRDIQLYVTCPQCGSQVASDQFTKHRDVAHGRREKSLRKRQAPVPSNTGSSYRTSSRKDNKRTKADAERVRSNSTGLARKKGEVEVERPSWWDNLDATKNCGYPAREEGRYGSYPSHDGFDDESKP